MSNPLCKERGGKNLSIRSLIVLFAHVRIFVTAGLSSSRFISRYIFIFMPSVGIAVSFRGGTFAMHLASVYLARIVYVAALICTLSPSLNPPEVFRLLGRLGP